MSAVESFPAPELAVAEWLNTNPGNDITLADLVGVDAHEPGSDIPVTTQRYQLRGTPSLVVIDRAGQVRANEFGQHDDLAIGALLARLIDEPKPAGLGPDGSESPTNQASTVQP